MHCVLCLTEASQFQEVPFIIVLSVCATRVIFGKWSALHIRSRLLPIFSSIRFNVVGFILKFLVHLDLSFMHGDGYGSICILLHSLMPAPFAEDAFFFFIV